MPPVAKLVRMRVADRRRGDPAAILEPVRAAAAEDPGTETWSLHGDREDPNVVFIYERYRDHEALQAHDQLPVLREAISKVGAVLQGPPRSSRPTC